MKIIEINFKDKIHYDNLNNLELRSDIENDNIGFSKEYVSAFVFEGYVGNRPSDFEGEHHEDDTWAIDLHQDSDTVESYLYSSKYEYLQDVAILTTNKVKQFYNLDMVCTGNHKADNINSRIMELADDYAEMLAQKDWELADRPENFWIEEEDGSMRMNAEAHEIWEVYYDEKVDQLYHLLNTCLEINEPTEEEKAIERLGQYVSEDDVPTAYKVLLDASEEFGDKSADDYVLMWQPMSDRYTVNELLAEL